MFDYQYALALGVGLVFSFPFGPMGLRAADMWLQGYKRVALAIVAGICLGDMAVGGMVMASLKYATPVDVPKPLVAVLMLVIAVMFWFDNERGRHGMPVRSVGRSFGLAFGWTICLFSNWATYWGVYGLGTGYLIKNYGDVLPAQLATLAPVSALNHGQLVMVMVCWLAGMLAGWGIYAVFLTSAAKGLRKVYPRRHRHKTEQRNLGFWVGRCASMIALSIAVVFMGQSIGLV